VTALEREGNPVCAICWPTIVGNVWFGAYGSAKIHVGEPLAVTSDGRKHPL